MATHHRLAVSVIAVFSIAAPWAAGANLPPTAANRGTTLEECFRVALSRAKSAAIPQELLVQAEAHLSQAKGAMLPTVTGLMAFSEQDTPASLTNQAKAATPAFNPLTKISATQPLFRGLRDFAALRQAEGLGRAAALDRRAAELQVYKDVIQAFFTVISLETDRKDVESEGELFEKRIAELKRFQRIGRSRLSEVLAAEATFANLNAQKQQLTSQIAAARDVLAILTGLDPSVPLTAPASPPVTAIKTALLQLSQRPEIRAAEERSHAAAEGIAIARGQHYPNIDLTGNYYLRREGLAKDVTWDLQLALTVPIYSGGIITSQVDEALSKVRQADLQAEQAKLVAEQELRTLHDAAIGDQAQIDELTVATDLSRRSYEENTREYRLGLVTNLEVLSSLQNFEESQRALDRARIALTADLARLNAATGYLPKSSLP